MLLPGVAQGEVRDELVSTYRSRIQQPLEPVRVLWGEGGGMKAGLSLREHPVLAKHSEEVLKTPVIFPVASATALLTLNRGLCLGLEIGQARPASGRLGGCGGQPF